MTTTDLVKPTASLDTSDLAQLGLNFVAYVRPTMVEEEEVFAICAADGTQMGLAPSRDIAFAAIRQHELEPVSVH